MEARGEQVGSAVRLRGMQITEAFVDRLKETTDARVKFLGHVGNAEHVKELHCNAYAYLHGHSLGGTNPALLKALGYGNCVFALGTAFNQEVLQDYRILFENDAADLARKIQNIENHPDIAAGYRTRAPQRIRESLYLGNNYRSVRRAFSAVGKWARSYEGAFDDYSAAK